MMAVSSANILPSIYLLLDGVQDGAGSPHKDPGSFRILIVCLTLNCTSKAFNLRVCRCDDVSELHARWFVAVQTSSLLPLTRHSVVKIHLQSTWVLPLPGRAGPRLSLEPSVLLLFHFVRLHCVGQRFKDDIMLDLLRDTFTVGEHQRCRSD